MPLQCRDVMLRVVHTCRLTDSAADCARMMRDADVGFLPVLDGKGNVAGVVTDRDLVTRVLAEGRPDSTPAAAVMTAHELLACGPDEHLDALERRMAREKKHRALVMEREKVVGVISLSDIAGVERDHERTAELMAELAKAHHPHH